MGTMSLLTGNRGSSDPSHLKVSLQTCRIGNGTSRALLSRFWIAHVVSRAKFASIILVRVRKGALLMTVANFSKACGGKPNGRVVVSTCRRKN